MTVKQIVESIHQETQIRIVEQIGGKEIVKFYQSDYEFMVQTFAGTFEKLNKETVLWITATAQNEIEIVIQ